ncbi:MAG: 2-phospho-L-lactate guanylyltransferase [Burkholderiaceae bacterium]|nr:2-phospho-L-lactate guanylyltransferase [Burkholderiaceae bacterium]
MSASTLWAVMPVKPFAHAKQRLAPMLDADERAALACAMFDDVLRVLVSSPCLAGVLVVTDDVRAAAIARNVGAGVLCDPPEAGLVTAVRHAARSLAAARCPGMLVVPADLPLIEPADIELIGREHRASPSVTLVAASSDGGTNALACSPPDAMPICFGRHSFRQHHSAALAIGLMPTVLTLPRFSLDIDRPADLLALLEHPSSTRTCSYLVSSGIARRLGVPWACAHAADRPHAWLDEPIPGETGGALSKAITSL